MQTSFLEGRAGYVLLKGCVSVPADDNEEITSLPSPSAFQTTT